MGFSPAGGVLRHHQHDSRRPDPPLRRAGHLAVGRRRDGRGLSMPGRARKASCPISAGASLAGLGFTLLATVPGTYLLTRLFARPSFAFGLYFTMGGLGGVAGPLLYFGMMQVSGDWRSYWLVAGALVAAIGVLAALLVNAGTDVSATRKPIRKSPPELGYARRPTDAAIRIIAARL